MAVDPHSLGLMLLSDPNKFAAFADASGIPRPGSAGFNTAIAALGPNTPSANSVGPLPVVASGAPEPPAETQPGLGLIDPFNPTASLGATTAPAPAPAPAPAAPATALAQGGGRQPLLSLPKAPEPVFRGGILGAQQVPKTQVQPSPSPAQALMAAILGPRAGGGAPGGRRR